MQLLCPACVNLTEHQRLFAKNGCDIFKCTTCGLTRAVAKNFSPAQYYTREYFSGVHPDGYANYRATEPILRREFTRTVAFIRKYRDGGRLLEVGCAYGFFLAEAQQFYDVGAIEISQEAAEFCRGRGQRVVTGVATEETVGQFGALDVIVMLDVIEHLANPRDTLELCCRHLNPDGIVVLTTGDFSSLPARLARQHWRLMTPPQHLWYFTPKSMERLSKAAGLELETCDHPWKLVPLSLLTFQLRRMVGAGSKKPQRASHIGVPINMFDTMRCVLRKRGG
jgi:SAM-dependent methyltransferase